MRQPKYTMERRGGSQIREEIQSLGREPGRSKADRLLWSARRGRFSPASYNAASLVRRGVVVVCTMLALFVITGGASSLEAATKPGKKASRKEQSANKTSGISSKRDYKSKVKRKPPPPADNQHPRKVAKKPKQRPDNRPAADLRVGQTLPPPTGFVPFDTYVQFDAAHYYVGTEPTELNVETTTMIFTSASIVFNAAFIAIGDRSSLAAAAGILFGISSVAVASKEDATHSGLNYLLGATSIALSIWNLSGGIQANGPPDEFNVYEKTASSTYNPSGQAVSFSYSF